jgi:transcriptional regulator with XRE-family HTH domain
MPSVSKIVGANIRRIRIRKGIRQEDLAELAGLDPAHMSEIENGIAGSAQLKTIERVASALDVKMTRLLRGCP